MTGGDGNDGKLGKSHAQMLAAWITEIWEDLQDKKALDMSNMSLDRVVAGNKIFSLLYQSLNKNSRILELSVMYSDDKATLCGHVVGSDSYCWSLPDLDPQNNKIVEVAAYKTIQQEFAKQMPEVSGYSLDKFKSWLSSLQRETVA